MTESQQLYRLEAPCGSGWAPAGWIRVSRGVIVATSPNLERFFARLLVNVEHSVKQDGYRLVPDPSAPESADCGL